MSPTEFSNYIKQRAMQQQLHHSHGHTNGHLGPIGTASPSRSISPNPLSMNGGVQDPYYFPNNGMSMYQPYNAGPRNMFDSPHFPHPSDNIYANNGGGPASKYSPYLEQHNFYGMNGSGNAGGAINISANGGGGQLQLNGGQNGGGPSSSLQLNGNGGCPSNNGVNAQTPVSSPGSNQDSSKLLDGLNSFYSNPGPYQHLLVAN